MEQREIRERYFRVAALCWVLTRNLTEVPWVHRIMAGSYGSDDWCQRKLRPVSFNLRKGWGLEMYGQMKKGEPKSQDCPLKQHQTSSFKGGRIFVRVNNSHNSRNSSHDSCHSRLNNKLQCNRLHRASCSCDTLKHCYSMQLTTMPKLMSLVWKLFLPMTKTIKLVCTIKISAIHQKKQTDLHGSVFLFRTTTNKQRPLQR